MAATYAGWYGCCCMAWSILALPVTSMVSMTPLHPACCMEATSLSSDAEAGETAKSL